MEADTRHNVSHDECQAIYSVWDYALLPKIEHVRKTVMYVGTKYFMCI